MSNDIEIEDKITNLKKKMCDYDSMDDINKIKNIDLYNEIIKEKKICDEILKNNKAVVDSINIKGIEAIEYTDENISKILDRIQEIKNIKIFDTMKLHDLIKLFVEITNLSVHFKKYLSEKQLEIISV